MKKLLMTAALAATIMTAGEINAQVSTTEQAAQEQTTQDQFKEIELTEIPTAVTEAVKTDFKGAVISKAYVNDENQYKLVLIIKGTKSTVFANEKGEWIKPKK